MKPSALLVPLAVLGFTLAAHAQSSPRGAISFWKTGSALQNSQEIRVPDRAGGNDATMGANMGATVVDDKDVEGGKAIEFNGRQSTDLQTTLKAGKPVEIKGNKVYAEMDAKPELTEHAQSLMYFYGVLEFRAQPKVGQLEMVVWYPGAETTVATSVRAPLKVGKWNKISGSIEGSKITLTVNNNTVRGEIPDKAELMPVRKQVFFGTGNQRPVQGRIANMAICKDAP